MEESASARLTSTSAPISTIIAGVSTFQQKSSIWSIRMRGSVARTQTSRKYPAKDFTAKYSAPRVGILRRAGALPAAEEQHREQRADREGVQEFGGEEHPEADAGVFDVETGHDLGFGFEQLERRAGHLRQRGDQEHQRRQRGRGPEPETALGRDNSRKAHRAAEHYRDQHRQHRRHRVGYQLRHRPERAEQREFVVGGPAGHEDPEGREGSRRGEIQHPHVQVHAVGGCGQRDHRPQPDHSDHRQDRRDVEEDPVRPRRNHVLLEDQLEHVRDRLEQPVRADTVGPDPVLHAGDGLAFEPDQENDEHQSRDAKQEGARGRKDPDHGRGGYSGIPSGCR